MSMIFKFKEFDVLQAKNAQKVGTDSMVLGALSAQVAINVKSVLDIGCGTGVLGLMLLQKNQGAHLIAVDIQKENCREAQHNLTNAKFVETFEVIQNDVLNTHFNTSFDFIISNPPYFENALLSKSENRNGARHQNSLSIRELIGVVKRNLSPNGMFSVVYPSDLEEKVIRIAKESGLNLVNCIRSIHRDNFIRSFMFFAISNDQPDDPVFKVLKVREENGNYSKEYIRLTKDFHFTDLSK